MNRPVSRRALLGASAIAIGAVAVHDEASALADLAHPDADLFELIEGWGSARSASDAADERSDALWEELGDLEPERPAALHYSGADGLNCGFETEILPNGRTRLFYGLQEVDKLRKSLLPSRSEWVGRLAPWNPDEQVGHYVSVPDEPAIARRAEILVAHDAWWAECLAIRDRIGIPAADEAGETAAKALHEIEAAILATVPASAAGLVAKARWATGSCAPRADVAVWSARIAADVITMAERGGRS